MKPSSLISRTFLVLGLATLAPAQEIRIDSDTFGGLEARSIGPAVMSGRVSDLDAVQGDRLTIYVGAAAGGVWKSDDGGVRFKPVFDKYNPSIGDITIDRRNPKTIWVGTGESWVRNSVSVGDGIYRAGGRRSIRLFEGFRLRSRPAVQ
jgi:hypothetical protein